VTYLKLIS